MTWFSATQVDLDLFDVVKNVVGPLTFSFSYYKIMPQLNGPAPTIERGPINAAYPPAVPTPAAEHAARRLLQRREPVPGRQGERRPRHHPGRVRREGPHDRAGDPQPAQGAGRDRRAGGRRLRRRRERAHRPGAGARQLHAVHRDQQRRSRHRAGLPGQERHDGDQRRRDRRGAPEPVGQRQPCATCTRARCSTARRTSWRSRRATSRFVALSNHFASQSHQNACRISEAEYVRQQADGVPAGRARTSSSRVTSTTSSSRSRWARSTQGNVLTNLWSKAPAGPGLLVQVQRPPADARPHPRHRRPRFARHGLALRALRQRLLRAPAADRRHRHLRPRPAGRDVRAAAARARAQPGTITGTVPATLSLTLGTAGPLGPFIPGVGEGLHHDDGRDGHLDRRGRRAERDRRELDNATGRLVNGTHALRSPLQVNANGGAFAPLRTDNGPLALASWTTPITSRARPARLQAVDRGRRGPAHRQLRQDAHVHAEHDQPVGA